MRDFIDLEGASGVRYRFRHWPEGAPHTPMGGNYAFVRDEPGELTVVELGQTNNLAEAGSAWAKAARKGATHVFTRLNVSGVVRAHEHEDLAARYAAPARRKTG